MRVALVSPYSWTYPGGVTRHVEALAGELLAAGHDVRVFAPFDHDSRSTRLAHRGARPESRPMPEYLFPIGGTVGWPANGAVSNLALTPASVSALRRGLRAFAPDVVHLQEPVAQAAGWRARCPTTRGRCCSSWASPSWASRRSTSRVVPPPRMPRGAV